VGLRKTTKASTRITSAPVVVRTHHVQNVSLQICRYINLLSYKPTWYHISTNITVYLSIYIYNIYRMCTKEFAIVRSGSNLDVGLSSCLIKHHDMKTYGGSCGIAPCILKLSTRWRWVIRFTPRPIYSRRNSPWYPLYRRADGTQNRSGCCPLRKTYPEFYVTPNVVLLLYRP
jgi:hypothetical protein